MTIKSNLIAYAIAAAIPLLPCISNAEKLATGDKADIAALVVEGVGEGLDALARKKRSVAILIRNHTPYNLKSGEFNTSTGELTGVPNQIIANGTDTIEAYNSWGLKGTAGVVKYVIAGTSKSLIVCWSVPLGYVTQQNWFKYAVIDTPQWNDDYAEKLFDDMFNNRGNYTKGKLAKAVEGFSEWTTPEGWKVSGTMGNAGNAVVVCDIYAPDKPAARTNSTPKKPFELKIIKIVCIEASERRGDDLYLSFSNGTTFPPGALASRDDGAQHDLDDGEVWNVAKTIPFTRSTIRFGLYDADPARGNDDKLGEWTLPRKLTYSEKTVRATGDGSDYTIHYKVEGPVDPIPRHREGDHTSGE